MRDGQIVDKRKVDYFEGNIVESKFLGGAALYRRSALDKVRGFNPFLISDEEPELAMRLRRAGYRLLNIPYLMCTHYGAPENSWDYCVRRLRMNLWAGTGQVPRYHLKSGLLWTVLRERTASTVVYISGVLISFLCVLLTVFSRNTWPIVIWAMGLGAVLAAFVVKKRSLRETLWSLVVQGFIAYSAVRGFLMPTRSPADYPTDADIVKRTSREPV